MYISYIYIIYTYIYIYSRCGGFCHFPIARARRGNSPIEGPEPVSPSQKKENGRLSPIGHGHPPYAPGRRTEVCRIEFNIRKRSAGLHDAEELTPARPHELPASQPASQPASRCHRCRHRHRRGRHRASPPDPLPPPSCGTDASETWGQLGSRSAQASTLLTAK